MKLIVGNLYYWCKKIVVEYKGQEKGKYIFETTNGGKMTLTEMELLISISVD